MRTGIIIIVMLFFTGLQVFAQDAPADFEWIMIRQANTASLIQQGENNSMISIQEMNGMLGNQILSDQSGSSNIGYIKQVGELHFTRLAQSGSDNEANLWQRGQKVVSEVIQSGQNNTINSYIDNELYFPKIARLEQTGQNNTIELALLGNGSWSNSWPLAALIRQNGNNHSVSAKLESFSSPVVVSQQAGVSGEGMSITISNSAFYFPTK